MATFNYDTIKEELNLGVSASTTPKDLLDKIKEKLIFTDAEINKIKGMSVLPLGDFVKQKAEDLKKRIVNPVLDEDKGILKLDMLRFVALSELLGLTISVLNEKAEKDGNSTQDFKAKSFTSSSYKYMDGNNERDLIMDVNSLNEHKADKSYVDEELKKKSDKTYVDGELAKKADKNGNDAVDFHAKKVYYKSTYADGQTTAGISDIDTVINAIERYHKLALNQKVNINDIKTKFSHTYNTSNGVLKIKYDNTEILDIDLPTERIIKDAKLDGNDIVIEFVGTQTPIRIDVSKFIDTYNGSNGEQINISTSGNIITATLNSNSITLSHFSEELRSELENLIQAGASESDRNARFEAIRVKFEEEWTPTFALWDTTISNWINIEYPTLKQALSQDYENVKGQLDNDYDETKSGLNTAYENYKTYLNNNFNDKAQKLEEIANGQCKTYVVNSADGYENNEIFVSDNENISLENFRCVDGEIITPDKAKIGDIVLTFTPTTPDRWVYLVSNGKIFLQSLEVRKIDLSGFVKNVDTSVNEDGDTETSEITKNANNMVINHYVGDDYSVKSRSTIYADAEKIALLVSKETEKGLLIQDDKVKICNSKLEFLDEEFEKMSEFSGSYEELRDKPTIPSVPTNVSAFNNDSGYLTEQDISGKANSSDLSNVAISGSYNDLSNKPTIPTTLPASDVKAWAKADNKPTYTASEVNAIPTSAKGSANGVAELDANGKVPSTQLPSYVDDVLEYASTSNFPKTGESGKIYVATDTNKTYRWSGSAYVVISETLAIGTTATTAAAGNHTHNYAGSSSAGGAATSANKINSDAGSATQPVYFSNGVPVATTYSLGKSVPSDAVFTDTNTWRPLGTGADQAAAGNHNHDGVYKKLNVIKATCANRNNYPYHRILHGEATTSYVDKCVVLQLNAGYHSGHYGIVRIDFRSDELQSTTNTQTGSVSINWIVRKGYSVNDIQAGIYTSHPQGATGKIVTDIYLKLGGTYASTAIEVLHGSTRGNMNEYWGGFTPINSSEANNTTATDKLTSSECYTSVAEGGKALNITYTSTISGADVGSVNYANTAGALSSMNISQFTNNSGYITEVPNTFANGLKVSGRAYGSGDDEGIVVTPASNGHAGFTLGGHASRRLYFNLPPAGTNPKMRYNDGSTNYDITIPSKVGTLAVTSDGVVLTGGSQTTTSTASGGSNVYTFTKSDGTTSTLTVKNGTNGTTPTIKHHHIRIENTSLSDEDDYYLYVNVSITNTSSTAYTLSTLRTYVYNAGYRNLYSAMPAVGGCDSPYGGTTTIGLYADASYVYAVIHNPSAYGLPKTYRLATSNSVVDTII